MPPITIAPSFSACHTDNDSSCPVNGHACGGVKKYQVEINIYVATCGRYRALRNSGFARENHEMLKPRDLGHAAAVTLKHVLFVFTMLTADRLERKTKEAFVNSRALIRAVPVLKEIYVLHVLRHRERTCHNFCLRYWIVCDNFIRPQAPDANPFSIFVLYIWRKRKQCDSK